MWENIHDELRARGIVTGRGEYAGWDDSDPALARATWCLVRHLRPQRVIETGVGRGLTSRMVLQAMERNGRGHLWSIDKPPPLAPSLQRQIGAAVPFELRANWTYIRGSSRQRLARLVGQLKGIDLFIHDSAHTRHNVVFELETAWPMLHPGGAALVDDIDLSRGFERFVDTHHDEAQSLIGVSDDAERLLGVVAKVSTRSTKAALPA